MPAPKPTKPASSEAPASPPKGWLARVRRADGAAVPVINIESADNEAAQQAVIDALDLPNAPIVQWDVVRGGTGVNQAGRIALGAACGVDLSRNDKAALDQVWDMTQSPPAFLNLCLRLPAQSRVFFHNPQLFLDVPGVIQGIRNCRLPFEVSLDPDTPRSHRVLYPLGNGTRWPPELTGDVMVIREEPLTDDDLDRITREVLDGQGPLAPTLTTHFEEHHGEALAALRGLKPFAVKTVVATSLTRRGLDLSEMWVQKMAAVNMVRGLRTRMVTWPKFADVGGHDIIKRYYLNMRDEIAVVGLIDEGDKQLAGAGGGGGGADSTGVSQDAFMQLLTVIQDVGWLFEILLGVPGVAKTFLYQAIAAELGVPFVLFDLGAMKGQYVGNSEAFVRDAINAMVGMAGSHVLLGMTCNRLDMIPAEMKRRALGQWFFDLPNAKDREQIVDIQLRRYGLTLAQTGPVPDIRGWTGAEIDKLCRLAKIQKQPFEEVKRYVVPITRSDQNAVAALHRLAHGRFLSTTSDSSAPEDGSYDHRKAPCRNGCVPDSGEPIPQGAGRQVELPT